ncbi:SDR family oxidoreductase [Candidatus Odyssella acanthamoebae]|uniref:Short-chain dehydrogenase n=1 Tax=Candidatus Odyssella acanthamoebae TaxID=91604 RepID=A0A077B0J1_9PROT|nr:SDR family oxidoreductase [Candidatus Paracaedibacter acanthamoebae]AIK96430.1 short-chain dehydrogenase [Candidatus Paracaedibacter acanthamoebae]
MPTLMVTGAAQRIGRAIVVHFAKLGWDVVVHYHTSSQKAQNLKEEVEGHGQKCWLIQADLAQESQVSGLMEAVQAMAGRIDLLINNASTFKYDNSKTATRESWDYHMEPNLRAPLILSQEFQRLMRRGMIVNLLDQRVWNLTPHYLSYSISKYGLWGLTQALALAMAPAIRVNGIGPGPTLKNANQSQAQFVKQCTSTPLGIGGDTDEIARAIEFLWNAPSVTGQMIAMDGGQHLGWMVPANLDQRDD